MLIPKFHIILSLITFFYCMPHTAQAEDAEVELTACWLKEAAAMGSKICASPSDLIHVAFSHCTLIEGTLEKTLGLNNDVAIRKKVDAIKTGMTDDLLDVVVSAQIDRHCP